MNAPAILEIEAAEAAFLANELDRVESLCRAVLEQDEKHAVACHMLGAVALRRKDPQKALHWIEQALAYGLTNPVVLNNCGEALRQLGRLQEAYARFEQALRIDNLNPYPHFNLGLVMRAQGHPREAEHFFRSALLVNEDIARAYFELAELYREEGHWPEAEREYRNALASAERQNLGSADGVQRWRTRLASFLFYRGAPQDAIGILNQVLEEDTSDAIAHYELARAKFELCREQEAARAYLRATELSPTLGINKRPRIVMTQETAVKTWCQDGHGAYTALAPMQWLSLPPLKSCPEISAISFRLGAPVAPEIFCARLENAEVVPIDNVVLAGRSLFLGGVSNWPQQFAKRGHFSRYCSDDLRILLDLPENIEEYDGACVLLGGGGDHFAWMFETLARLWAIEQQPALADLPLVVPADLSQARLEMLDALGIPRSRLLPLNDDRTLRARELHVPSLLTVGNWVSPLALQYLRRRLSSGSIEGRRRVYLSRQGLADRRLANEADLLPALAGHGFEVVNVNAMTPLELLGLFNDAEAILAIDDEILANLVVAPRWARIGVIIPEGIYQTRTFLVCGQLGHDFNYLLGTPVFTSNPEHALCDVVLPESVLSAFLDGFKK